MTHVPLVGTTARRVENATSGNLNDLVYQKTIRSLTHLIHLKREQERQQTSISGAIPNKLQNNSNHESEFDIAVQQRQQELAKEWDMERILEFNASTLIVVASILCYLYNWKILIFVIGVAVFLWQHAVQGWCPPVPVFRKVFQTRTAAEIFTEVLAIRVLCNELQISSKSDKMSADSDIDELSLNKSSDEAYAEQLICHCDLHPVRWGTCSKPQQF